MKKNIHAQKLARDRWNATPKAKRSAHGKMMVEAREVKRKLTAPIPVIVGDFIELDTMEDSLLDEDIEVNDGD